MSITDKFESKSVLIWGYGIEGKSTEGFLKKYCKPSKVEIFEGKAEELNTDGFDYVIKSPGIPGDYPEDKFTSQTELFLEEFRDRTIGITGTKGKSTTTSMLYKVLTNLISNRVVLVGNIGIPCLDYYEEMASDSQAIAVMEMSCHQLNSVHVSPHFAVFLNLYEEHLDYYKTFERYFAAKANIAKYQTAEDYIVLNADDPETVKRADRVSCKKIFFSRCTEPENGVYIDGNGNVVIDDAGLIKTVMPLSDFKLLGTHNTENLLASVAIAYYMGVDAETIARVCANFKGVAHRIEFVRSLDDVNYYNDSKGTNPDAAIKGICAMDRPTLLIGGGYDKKIPFDDWILSFNGKVKRLVLIGQTREIIAECARKHGFNEIAFAESLEEAIDDCRAHAVPGDAVLLSPACASWGMFDNYEQRGDLFRDHVNGY